MRTGLRIWICGVLLLLLIAGRADAAPPASGGPADQCAVHIEGPRLTGASNKAFLWSEFQTMCKRNMSQIGAYACLMEIEYPGDPGRPVECSADRERGYFAFEVFTLTMIATCEYTTIPRYYQVSGYAWAWFLPSDGGLFGKSPDIRSLPWKKVRTEKGNIRYCHISAKNMRWKTPK